MAAMGEATQHFSHLWDAHMSFIFFYHFYISLHVFTFFVPPPYHLPSFTPDSGQNLFPLLFSDFVEDKT
jgi:hypothetical protein